MYISPLEHDVLRALTHGPLGQFEVAADIVSAPFMVRGSLKRLKREQLVREVWSMGHHGWELTARGWRVALEDDQLNLLEVKP